MEKRILEYLSQNRRSRSEEIAAALGVERGDDMLAFYLGMLHGCKKIVVEEWQGTNSDGQMCHLYSELTDTR